MKVNDGHHLVVHVTYEHVVGRRYVLFAGALMTSGPGTCCDVIADHHRRRRRVESTAAGAQLRVARSERRKSAYTTTSPDNIRDGDYRLTSFTSAIRPLWFRK